MLLLFIYLTTLLSLITIFILLNRKYLSSYNNNSFNNGLISSIHNADSIKKF